MKAALCLLAVFCGGCLVRGEAVVRKDEVPGLTANFIAGPAPKERDMFVCGVSQGVLDCIPFQLWAEYQVQRQQQRNAEKPTEDL